MTRILAIDTASEFASICLLTEGADPIEAVMHSPDGFAHLLFGQLKTLLDRGGITIADIDCFAAGSGPGSFTGVRVALSAAKGLAESGGKPIVAVSNLKALASYGSAPLRAALLDARRGEIYGGLYSSNLEPRGEECVMKFGDWIAMLPREGAELVATDFAPFAASVPTTIPVFEAPRYLAPAIARIALAEYRAGRAADPASVDANYVRRSDAELNWKDSLSATGP